MSYNQFQRLSQSLGQALREIVFGIEDGLISAFGLVIGVATGADSSFIVLLAGATGAIASAVSMSAGTYLSVKSERDMAEKELADEAERISRHPEQEEQEVIDFLRQRGFSDEEIATVLQGTRRSPSLLLELMAAHELHIGRAERAQPWSRAAWMFAADLIAAMFPVAPFAVFPLDLARMVSIGLTALALIILGVGRGVVTRRKVPVAVMETLGIAATAAVAGFAIAQVVSSWAGAQVPVSASFLTEVC